MARLGFLSRWQDVILALLRIVTALLFLEHGTSKVLGFPEDPNLGIQAAFSLFWIAGVIEIVGGTLVLLGLFTGPAAFILSGEMAIAYFKEHLAIDFFPIRNYGDGAVMFSLVFLYLSAAGPGALSLDGFLFRRRAPAK